HPPNADASCRASFALDGRFRRFKGWVVLNDYHAETFNPVRFVVRGDGKLLWQSGEITRKGGPQEFDIDVAGVEILLLETRLASGLSLMHAHALWFEPWLEK